MVVGRPTKEDKATKISRGERQMKRWNTKNITINHSVENYIYVPFKDALFREKSI